MAKTGGGVDTNLAISCIKLMYINLIIQKIYLRLVEVPVSLSSLV